jgi:asparagine synthase (glutamine-hydrolysing)
MCGIAAIFAYDINAGPVSDNELIRIRDYMTARGPDGYGIWKSQEGRVALGHRRLAIIDLSDAGAQPMVCEDAGLAITFNGEIYNYRELKASLENKGYRFRSNSDTEVLLRMYEDMGPEMVHKLRGMYAFSIWDEKRKGLFLARDSFGIKPLYYADDGKCIRVASQVKALLAGSAIATTPEPAGHVGFFLWGHVPEPYTLYKGIRALPAGSTMWVDRSGRRNISKFCSTEKWQLRRQMLSGLIAVKCWKSCMPL